MASGSHKTIIASKIPAELPNKFDPNNCCYVCNKYYKFKDIYRNHLKQFHKITVAPPRRRATTRKRDLSILPDPANPNFHCRSCNFSCASRDDYAAIWEGFMTWLSPHYHQNLIPMWCLTLFIQTSTVIQANGSILLKAYTVNTWNLCMILISRRWLNAKSGIQLYFMRPKTWNKETLYNGYKEEAQYGGTFTNSGKGTWYWRAKLSHFSANLCKHNLSRISLSTISYKILLHYYWNRFAYLIATRLA